MPNPVRIKPNHPDPRELARALGLTASRANELAKLAQTLVGESGPGKSPAVTNAQRKSHSREALRKRKKQGVNH